MSRILLIVWLLILFLVFSALFWFRAPHIFIGFDGGYVLDLAIRQLQSESELHALNADFLSSLGHIYYPTNFKLFPSFWFLYWISDIDTAKATVLSAIMIEVLFSSFLFARTVGLSKSLAITSSALLCICLFPFHGVGYVFSLIPMVPHIGTSIAVVLLMVVCFIRFGKEGTRQNWLWAAAFLVLVVWCAFASISSLLISGCFIVLTTLCMSIFAESRSEKKSKASLLGITAILFCILGPALYLVGLTMNSVPVMFPSMLEDNVTNIAAVSILFHRSSYGIIGPLLVVSGAVGALWSFFKGSRSERVFAGVLLLFFAFQAVSWIIMYLTKAWRGPAPLYLEIYFIPLYTVFAVSLFSRLFGLFTGLITRYLRPIRLSNTMRELFIASLAIAIPTYLVSTETTANYGFTYPPSRSAIIDILENAIVLNKGSEFKGRVATLTGRTIAKPIGWLDLHSEDASRAVAIGNEHRVTGLNKFHIPNFFPYGPSISPGLFFS